MGDDTPLSVLSQQPRPLSTYFKQRFAQVTNPPIDSLREQLVMSLTTYLGSRGDLLADAEPTGNAAAASIARSWTRAPSLLRLASAQASYAGGASRNDVSARRRLQ